MPPAASANQFTQLSELEQGVVLLTLDMPGSSANILTDELFDELDAVMLAQSTRSDLRGLILFSAKPNIFIAGADLKSIAATPERSDDEIAKFCQRGRAVMARFNECPFITVAAIHGACVGGGLEVALWCDRRIASESPRTQIGLPEVKLGLTPAWGGTVRLPRFVGFDFAAELITSGRLISAAEALAGGLVDAVTSAENLITTAKELILRVEAGSNENQSTPNISTWLTSDREIITGPVKDLPVVADSTTRLATAIGSNEEVFPFAPAVVLEHLSRTASLNQAAALESETAAMIQLYGSPASRGLLNHFFLIDRNKKQPGLVDMKLSPRSIKTVAIIGAGLMGRSIAEQCLTHGMSVRLFDANQGLAQQVAQSLNQHHHPAQCEAITNIQSISGVDLVMETIVENAAIKIDVLKKIEAAVSAETLIASNTSAIPISTLAAALQRPHTFCGIHFCHPELMALVEVVCGPQTAEQTIADAVGFVRSLKKMAVAMNDGPGFVVNRLLAAMIDEAFRILTIGANNGTGIGEIDQAMRDFGFRGGPFEIIDVIGADTCWYAGRTMFESGSRCVTLSPILPKMVKSGRLGRKSGKGFYQYPDPLGEAVFDPECVQLMKPYLTVPKDASQKISAAEITMRIASAMVLEATRILDESLVADPRDIELCVIEGFAFPKHRGGIFYWADSVGLQNVLQTLQAIAAFEPRLTPSERLQSLVRNGELFYGS